MSPHRSTWMSRSVQCIGAGIVMAAMAVVLSGCRKPPSTAAPPVPEVAVTDVIQRDVTLYSEWVGTTEGFVNADIYPKISGYLIKQNYQNGDVVHAGRLLFQIDPREYQAALDQALGNLAQVQAQLKQNQLNLARYTLLFKQGVISQEEFDNQTQTTRATSALVQANQAAVETAKLNLGWTQVTSPIRRDRRDRNGPGRRSRYTHDAAHHRLASSIRSRSNSRSASRSTSVSPIGSRDSRRHVRRTGPSSR